MQTQKAHDTINKAVTRLERGWINLISSKFTLLSLHASHYSRPKTPSFSPLSRLAPVYYFPLTHPTPISPFPHKIISNHMPSVEDHFLSYNPKETWWLSRSLQEQQPYRNQSDGFPTNLQRPCSLANTLVANVARTPTVSRSKSP